MRRWSVLPLVALLGTACSGSSTSGPSDTGRDLGRIDLLTVGQDVLYSTDESSTTADAFAGDPGVTDGIFVQPDTLQDPGTTSDPGIATDPGALDPGTPFDPGTPTDTGPCVDCKGAVGGLTCAPTLKTALPHVRVWVDGFDCKGKAVHVQTYSDTTGHYLLQNVPCGTQTIHMEKGTFTYQIVRNIEEGVTANGSSGDACAEAFPGKIAVITGDWDAIEDTLDMLFPFVDEYDGRSNDNGGGAEEAIKLLTDYAKLSEYDALFINCSDSASTVMSSHGSVIGPNLQAFVQKGGSMYMSDYAHPYFDQVWPNAAVLGGHVVGGHQDLDGEILNADLVAFLGKDHVQFHLGLGPLTKLVAAGAGTETHVQAYYKEFAETLPVMISFKPYPTGGNVVYTMFHNEEQADVWSDMTKILDWTVFLQ